MNINKKDKIRGIVYAYTNEKRYDLVRDLGVEWIRLNIPFPWEDRINGKVSERWKKAVADIKEAVSYGIKVMPATPTVLGFHEDICGKRGTDKFYKNVRTAAQFMCSELTSIADSLWQCMNEIDHPLFSGDVPHEICAEACRQTAMGILDVNPSARCGTTFASWDDRTKDLGHMLCAGENPFYFIGMDCYFGSWAGGNVEDWIPLLDSIWEEFKMPILVNEWGFSSRGNPGELHLTNSNGGHYCFDTWKNTIPGGHCEEVQAEYFRRGIEIFAKHPHVLGDFMFCFSDAESCWQCGQKGCPAECYWGLCHNDLSPKPSYYAVKETIARLYLT